MPATNGTTNGDAFAIHNEGAFLFTVSLLLLLLSLSSMAILAKYRASSMRIV